MKGKLLIFAVVLFQIVGILLFRPEVSCAGTYKSTISGTRTLVFERRKIARTLLGPLELNAFFCRQRAFNDGSVKGEPWAYGGKGRTYEPQP